MTDGAGRVNTALQAAWRCTGTMLDDSTFLTAGQWTYGAEAVSLWFDEDVDQLTWADFGFFSDAQVNADAWSTTALSHPDYDDSAFYLHDVGVVDDVVLNPGTTFEAYGELPELGYWDEQLATGKRDRDSYTTVGYGLQRSLPDQGAVTLTEALWVRLKAHGELLGNRQFDGGKTNDAYVVLTNNANTGGTCSGDSGGPTFIEDTTTVVAVTSFGVNTTCTGTGGVYRIDTVDDLAWISSFVG